MRMKLRTKASEKNHCMNKAFAWNHPFRDWINFHNIKKIFFQAKMFTRRNKKKLIWILKISQFLQEFIYDYGKLHYMIANITMTKDDCGSACVKRNLIIFIRNHRGRKEIHNDLPNLFRIKLVICHNWSQPRSSSPIFLPHILNTIHDSSPRLIFLYSSHFKLAKHLLLQEYAWW